MYRILFSTASLKTLLDLWNKHENITLYTAFPICVIKAVSEPDKKGDVTITTDCGTITTNLKQTGHFLKVPEAMVIPLSSVADPSYTARIERFEKGQGLEWGS